MALVRTSSLNSAIRMEYLFYISESKRKSKCEQDYDRYARSSCSEAKACYFSTGSKSEDFKVCGSLGVVSG